MASNIALWGDGPAGGPVLTGFDPDALTRARQARRRRVAVMVPLSGSAGIWGPSCISCAQLAAAEINAGNGIAGREVELLFLDADDAAIARTLPLLEAAIDDDAVDAIVGMHVSSVRQKLVRAVRGRQPYVYTPLYEGGERTPNVFTIGDTPGEQLAPALRRLASLLKVRRWALIGNDYVWPRVTHRHAHELIRALGGQVVFEHYVPFGLEEPVELVERMAAARPDIAILSLVGQEADEFNRVFGAMGLDRAIARFSTAIEENVLLASGAQSTEGLYAASSYFSTLKTQSNLAFKERYHAMHRERAPVLNALGQSMYEGMHFYASLQDGAGRTDGAVGFRSARGGRWFHNERKDNPIYLARADGHLFTVMERLG